MNKKKFIAVLIAIVTGMFSYQAFAVDSTVNSNQNSNVNYSGDIQLNIGYRFQANNSDYLLNAPNDWASLDYLTHSFTFGFEGFNLFGVSKNFSVGFFYNINYFVGNSKITIGGQDSYYNKDEPSTGFNTLIGPAFGLDLGRILKLQVGIGFLYTYESLCRNTTGNKNNKTSYYIDLPWSLGCGVNVQAKFLPKSPVSPILGLRYEFAYTNQYRESLKVGDSTSAKKDRYNKVKSDFFTNSLDVYVGVSYNF